MNIIDIIKEINDLEKNPRGIDETNETWTQLNMIQGYRRLIALRGEVPVIRIEYVDGRYICKSRENDKIISREEARDLLFKQYEGFIEENDRDIN